MHRFVLVAAVLLAACQVDVEGAPCEAPGSADECPADQACGNDRRCSRRAASCDRCEPAELKCADGLVQRCTERDPVCGAWEAVRDCASDGLVCASGPAACACPAATASAFHFDEDAGAGFEGIAPTGAAAPPGCRLASLVGALALAAEAGPGASAVAAGVATTHALEAPVELPAGVTLTTTTPDVSGAHVLSVAALETGTTPAVTLGAGAALEGFEIRNDGALQGRAIEVVCDAGAPAVLRRVTVEGTFAAPTLPDRQLSRGVQVSGACGLEAEDLRVRGVSGPALAVETAAGTVTALTGGSLAASGVGVDLRSGALVLREVQVTENAGTGVLAGDADGGTSLDAERCLLAGNGDSGLVLFRNTRIRLVENVIEDNAGATDRSTALRRAGGIVFRGEPPADDGSGAPALVFRGNQLRRNRGDQAIVYGATSPWMLDGDPSCNAAGRNVFACYDAEAAGYGLVAVDAPVSVRWSSWQSAIPVSPPDFRALGTASVDAGTEGAERYCAAAPACPAP